MIEGRERRGLQGQMRIKWEVGAIKQNNRSGCMLMEK